MAVLRKGLLSSPHQIFLFSRIIAADDNYYIQTVEAMQKWPEEREPNKTVSSLPPTLYLPLSKGFMLHPLPHLPPFPPILFSNPSPSPHSKAPLNHPTLNPPPLPFTHQIPQIQGFSLAQNTSKSVFSYLEDHPSKAKRFAGAMTSLSTSPGHSPASLIHAYPWSSLGAKTIIDVGGSNGIYSIALAQSFPELKFVIQDLPAVISANTKNPIPVGLKDRVSFMPHDMFTPQPVVADVYMVRFVFHDWPDKHVVEILRNLIPALKPGARIIINDSILPEPGTLSELYERKIR